MRYDELLDAIQADRARATEAEARRRLLVRSRQGRTGAVAGTSRTRLVQAVGREGSGDPDPDT